MARNNKTADQLTHPASLSKRMLLGGGIALILITAFLLPVFDDPKPEWGKLWMIRPLVIVSLAGAAGGGFYYFMDDLRLKGGLAKVLANLLSLLVYIVALWLGSVLGLDGTLWD